MEGEQWNWRFCALLSWRHSPRYTKALWDTKASPSETDTKSARLERIFTIWEERFSWKVELESGRFWLLPKWQWKVLCQNFGCEEIRSDIPKHINMKADTLKEKIGKYMTVKIIRFSERRNRK